jgi:hypothetical protein
LIVLLKKRGEAITDLDFETIRTLEYKIDQLMKDPSKYDSLTVPVCAFITF